MRYLTPAPHPSLLPAYMASLDNPAGRTEGEKSVRKERGRGWRSCVYLLASCPSLTPLAWSSQSATFKCCPFQGSRCLGWNEALAWAVPLRSISTPLLSVGGQTAQASIQGLRAIAWGLTILESFSPEEVEGHTPGWPYCLPSFSIHSSSALQVRKFRTLTELILDAQEHVKNPYKGKKLKVRYWKGV